MFLLVCVVAVTSPCPFVFWILISFFFFFLVLGLWVGVKVCNPSHLSLTGYILLQYIGSVFAWGSEYEGGKIPDKIQSLLHQNVKMIFPNDNSFVALLNNDQVITWRDNSYYGKITGEIQTRLKNFCKEIFSSRKAFSALLNDGSVFTWEILLLEIKFLMKFINLK